MINIFGDETAVRKRKLFEVQLMLVWVSEVPVTAAVELTGITAPTSIHWYQYFRDICYFHLKF